MLILINSNTVGFVETGRYAQREPVLIAGVRESLRVESLAMSVVNRDLP